MAPRGVCRCQEAVGREHELRGSGEEELRRFEDMLTIPEAIFWSQEASSFLVEPWRTENHACDYCQNIAKMTGVLNCPVHAEIALENRG